MAHLIITDTPYISTLTFSNFSLTNGIILKYEKTNIFCTLKMYSEDVKAKLLIMQVWGFFKLDLM